MKIINLLRRLFPLQDGLEDAVNTHSEEQDFLHLIEETLAPEWLSPADNKAYADL
ncbi:MAG: hypothetical protein KGL98_03290 [Gammaproteobacteria bacterium]|nr:hypothetical protein [Gammaproteobacteria bacterium]MBU6510230.1 hypothetical protein [Gammaproteobacteria bacterium]MDE1984865.1 hypothetical protein [Gammaproteobacteria bacterium]MDE2109461.1 hypothetical protein [Gammaproteobacteria bacterium]MDE2460249.1 hypothetical protein [Gammaproteobacteria bacterium]